MFDIATHDYETERDLFKMWQWIDETARRIWESESCDEIWFGRRDRNVKRFFEEAIPIGLFGLYLHRPGLILRVACKTGNQPFDATITTEDPSRKREFKVEVTVVEDKDSAWRREALATQGFCPAWGPIRREKKDGRIVADIVMKDMGELWNSRIEMAFDRAREKVEKAPPYEPGTAIVVYSEEMCPPEAWWRRELISRTQDLMDDKGRHLSGVYYIYSDDRSVIAVKPQHRG